MKGVVFGMEKQGWMHHVQFCKLVSTPVKLV